MASYRFNRFKFPVFVLLGMLAIFEGTNHSVRIFIHYLMADFDAQTEGRILASELETIGRYGYYVQYSYVVNDRLYESSMVKYSGRSVDAKEIVGSYKKNQVVTVYYDSDKPYLSILNKTTLGIEIYIHLLVSLCLFWLVYYLEL